MDEWGGNKEGKGARIDSVYIIIYNLQFTRIVDLNITHIIINKYAVFSRTRIVRSTCLYVAWAVV